MQDKSAIVGGRAFYKIGTLKTQMHINDRGTIKKEITGKSA